jgi:hypothetical protein
MNHLFNLLVAALILLNVTGLTLLVKPLTRLPYGLAQAAACLGGCLGFFFVEHYIGLGRMGWMLPLGSAASAWLAWRGRAALRANFGANAWLLTGFFYCLAWRYLFPNIDASTERMADLSFVADYWLGTRLPPPDLWFPPYTLNHYYSLQHYAAGLLGRLAGLGPGMSYHMAYCLLTGLTMSAAYEAVRLLCARRWAQALVLAVFLAGGTGATIFTPFMIKNARTNETAWCSMRFIGTTTSPFEGPFAPERMTWFGRKIQNLVPPSKKKEDIQELPMETFSYVVELGDYHAPLGGGFLLAVSLGAVAMLLRRPAETLAAKDDDAPPPLPVPPGENAAAQALLAATLPLTLATNTWTLPFQAALAFGCLFYLWLERGMRPNWAALLGGAAGVTLALFPFLTYFLPLTVGNNAPLTWVKSELRTPTPYFLMVFWPMLIVCLLHFFWTKRERKLLAFFWLLMLAASEMFFMDDIYGGGAERFNSTLKWWPWVFNGSMLGIAAMNLDSPRRAVRITTAVVLALVLTYTIRLGLTYKDGMAAMSLAKKNGQPTAFGQLDGAGWLGGNAFYSKEINKGVGSMLTFLKTQPRGVLVEKPDERAFAQVGAFSLFTGLPSLIGWTSHENLWRNDQTDIERRYNTINDLYAGTLPDPLRYLGSHGVRYILWLPRNNKPDAPEALGKLQAQLAPQYDWNEFARLGNDAVGVWVRRSPSAP